MAKIAARVPTGSGFDGTMMVGRDALALRLLNRQGGRSTVIVGTVTQVDGVFRMVHPGFVDQPATKPIPRSPRQPKRRSRG